MTTTNTVDAARVERLKAQVMALASGDAWLEKGANIQLFGPPSCGKSHLSTALGLAPVENGWRVMFARTTDPMQRLHVARRELALESTIAKPSPSRRTSFAKVVGADHLRLRTLAALISARACPPRPKSKNYDTFARPNSVSCISRGQSRS
jgi:hypothetical protein